MLSSASRVSPLTRIRNKEKSTNKIQMKLRPFAYFKQSSLKTDKTLSASPWAKLGLLLRGEKIALLHLIFFGRQKKMAPPTFFYHTQINGKSNSDLSGHRISDFTSTNFTKSRNPVSHTILLNLL